jgi:hypothetical protein
MTGEGAKQHGRAAAQMTGEIASRTSAGDRGKCPGAALRTAEHAYRTATFGRWKLQTPGEPAAQAYRARIRARYAELYDERTRTETALAAAQTATTQANDPALLDELPLAGDIVSAAPDRIKEAIYAAFDIHALYRHDQHQVTIWATITPATPATIAALMTDPRTDSDTHPGTPPPAPIRGHSWCHPLVRGPCATSLNSGNRAGECVCHRPIYRIYRGCVARAPILWQAGWGERVSGSGGRRRRRRRRRSGCRCGAGTGWR